MSAPPPVVQRKPPALGSFPLDVEGTCKKFVEKYLQCVRTHDTRAAPCRELMRQYLECRMNHGLMEPAKPQDIGLGTILDMQGNINSPVDS
jgi:cytochrome c oxidase assembly protein subunit 19